MAMNTPLQLEHYFFEKMHCVANPDFDFEQAEEENLADSDDFLVKTGLARNTENEQEFQIRVEAQFQPGNSKSARYEFEFSAVGFFKVDPDFEHDDIERLVQINGASVLYSAMREFVLTITSRGPYGPLMLPTINFRLFSQAGKQE